MKTTDRVIVLVIDGLGAGHLGPYGNTCVDTPHFNRLATECVLSEFMLGDSPDLSKAYDAYWRGTHAMAEATGEDLLPAALQERGIRSALLTDEPIVAGRAASLAFTDRLILAESMPRKAATEIAQTQFARVFAAILDMLDADPAPQFVWAHAQGMQAAWDAPFEFRERLADVEDPTPPDFVDPPQLELEVDHDPDDLLGIVQAYAGQVRLLDECLGVLLDALEALPLWRDAWLIVTAPRGYPLGEHRFVGRSGQGLNGELLHVPCFLRLPGGHGAAVRTPQLVQPADLFSTLAAGLGLPRGPSAVWGQSLLPLAEAANSGVTLRNQAAAIDGTTRAFRTPAWFLQMYGDGRRELFAKPDDRWEVNEVSDRCRDVTNAMEQALGDFQQAACSGRAGQLPVLPSLLVEA